MVRKAKIPWGLEEGRLATTPAVRSRPFSLSQLTENLNRLTTQSYNDATLVNSALSGGLTWPEVVLSSDLLARRVNLVVLV